LRKKKGLARARRSGSSDLREKKRKGDTTCKKKRGITISQEKGEKEMLLRSITEEKKKQNMKEKR